MRSLRLRNRILKYVSPWGAKGETYNEAQGQSGLESARAIEDVNTSTSEQKREKKKRERERKKRDAEHVAARVLLFDGLGHAEECLGH